MLSLLVVSPFDEVRQSLHHFSAKFTVFTVSAVGYSGINIPELHTTEPPGSIGIHLLARYRPHPADVWFDVNTADVHSAIRIRHGNYYGRTADAVCARAWRVDTGAG